MQNFAAVVDHANKVLTLQPDNVKALFRKGKVRREEAGRGRREGGEPPAEVGGGGVVQGKVRRGGERDGSHQFYGSQGWG